MSDQIVIALDLDETLIYSTLSELNRLPDFYFENYNVFVRPHLNTFIRKCSELFNIAIWSSAGETYVVNILTNIIPLSVDLLFIWTRPMFADGKVFSPDTIGTTKNLRRLISNGFDPCKVLVIDDNPDDSVIEFGNALQVKPYRGQLEDVELLLLSQYLEKVRAVRDTRNISNALWRSEVS